MAASFNATTTTTMPNAGINLDGGINGILEQTGVAAGGGGVVNGPTTSGAPATGSTLNNPDNPNIRTKTRQVSREYLGSTLTETETQAEETKTKSQVMTEFYNIPSNSDELRLLQERLFRAGYYGNLKSSEINFGSHDSVTAGAYSDFLNHASEYTQANEDATLDSALDEEGEGGSLEDEGGRVNKIALPNPDEMKAIINATAPKVLGRRADPATTQAIMDAYMQQSVASQEAANSIAETGGAYYTPPEFSQTYVSEKLREAQPEQAAVTDFGDRYAAFNDLINSSNQNNQVQVQKI